MNLRDCPFIWIVGDSGTRKTAMAEDVLRLLAARGVRTSHADWRGKLQQLGPRQPRVLTATPAALAAWAPFLRECDIFIYIADAAQAAGVWHACTKIVHPGADYGDEASRGLTVATLGRILDVAVTS